MENKSAFMMVIGLIVGVLLATAYFTLVADNSTAHSSMSANEMASADIEVRDIPLIGNDPQPAIAGYDNEAGSVAELLEKIDVLQVEIEMLRLENDDLRQGSMGLAESADHNEKRYSDINEQLVSLTQENKRLQYELGQLVESEVSDEQMKSLLKEPFSNFLLGFKGKQRDEVYDFFQQPEDHDWGYDMQLKISDFIESHEYRDNISLIGVTCKINQCELRIIESDPSLGYFNLLFQQMRSQPWWTFRSTHSTSGNSNGDGMKIFFYLKV